MPGLRWCGCNRSRLQGSIAAAAAVVYPLRATKPTRSKLSFPINGRPEPPRVPALRASSSANNRQDQAASSAPYPNGEERMRSGGIETKWLAAPWREASGSGPPSPGKRGICGSPSSPQRCLRQPCFRESCSELQIRYLYEGRHNPLIPAGVSKRFIPASFIKKRIYPGPGLMTVYTHRCCNRVHQPCRCLSSYLSYHFPQHLKSVPDISLPPVSKV